MKKLSLLMLLSVFVFWGCSNDDDEVKNEVTLSFENLLTEENSEFISKAGEPNNQGFLTIMPIGEADIVSPDLLI